MNRLSGTPLTAPHKVENLDQAQALVTVEDGFLLIEGISYKVNGHSKSMGFGSLFVCVIYDSMMPN
jgi:hypothetical protein